MVGLEARIRIWKHLLWGTEGTILDYSMVRPKLDVWIKNCSLLLISTLPASSKTNLTIFGGGKISTVLAENTGDVPFLFDFSTFAFNCKNQKSSGWIGFARRYDERLHRNITLYLACRTWFIEYCVIIIHALSHQEDYRRQF